MRYVTVLTLLVCLRAHAQTPPAGWVVLPLNYYDALRAKSQPADPEPEPLPFAATLSRVDYELALAAEQLQVTGRVTLEVDVLRDGWVQIPLPTGLVVSDARLPASCKLAGNALGFSKKGRYTVQLDIALPVTFGGNDQRVALPAANSGITRASLTLGVDGLEVAVVGGVSTSKADPWIAWANGAEPMVISWRRKVQEQPREELPLKLNGTLAQSWSLGEDSSALAADATLDVAQGLARHVVISVPKDVTVNQVLGGNVAEWTQTAGALTVNFLEAVERQTKFVIQGEAKLPREGAFDLPLLRLQGVDREMGSVAVDLLGPAEIKNATPAGLEQTDAPQSPATASGRLTFRMLPRVGERSLRVEVARYTPQALLTANVEEARIHAIATVDGKTLVQARYAIRNNQRNFVKIDLPTGAQVWNAAVAGRIVKPGKSAEGTLMLPLIKPASAEESPAFLVEVTYLVKGQAWTPRGRAVVVLPKVDVPVSRSAVALFLPAQYKVTAEPGAYHVEEFRATESLAFRTAFVASAATANPLLNSNVAMANAQKLADAFRARKQSRLPVVTADALDFPSYGPSIFLTAELTAENQQPQIELSYQEQKGGSQ
ncbi:MAG: hypothetical protein U0Q16_20710 [Bryobacteraceae bacterium]